MKSIHNYNLARRFPAPYRVALFVSVVCCVIWLVAPNYRYESTQTAGLRLLGMLWAQLAHMSSAHLILNLLGLGLVVWGFTPWWSGLDVCRGLVAGIVGVAIGLAVHPQVLWYCGLSGALHGLMVYGLFSVMHHPNSNQSTYGWAGVIAVGLLVKLILESYAPHVISNPSSIGGPILHQSHQWGAIGGLLVGLGLLLSRRFWGKP